MWRPPQLHGWSTTLGARTTTSSASPQARVPERPRRAAPQLRRSVPARRRRRRGPLPHRVARRPAGRADRARAAPAPARHGRSAPPGRRLRPPRAADARATGLSLDLIDLVGPAAGELVERCDAADSIAGRFRIVAEWIGDASRGRAAWTRRSPGRSRSSTRAAARCRSQTLRERRGLVEDAARGAFREQVGLTPKLYARVVRFHQRSAAAGRRARRG